MTRHLSVRVSSGGPERQWMVEILQTLCPKGKPARCESLMIVHVDLQDLVPTILDAVQLMVIAEKERHGKNEVGRRERDNPAAHLE